MSHQYRKQDIILLPGAELKMYDEDINVEQILKVFNDPDHRDEEAAPHTVDRFFDSTTNPRTLHISFYKAQSLEYAPKLYQEPALIVIEAITVKRHVYIGRQNSATDPH